MNPTVISHPLLIRAARLHAIALGVKMERNGFRVTRGKSALALAKLATNNRTNDRTVQITLLKKKAQELEDEVARTQPQI